MDNMEIFVPENFESFKILVILFMSKSHKVKKTAADSSRKSVPNNTRKNIHPCISGRLAND
jgi:hypothetical protein